MSDVQKETVETGTTSTNQSAKATAPKKGRFGVSKDQQGGSFVSIPAPIKLPAHTDQFKTGYEFPIGRLVLVKFNPEKEVKSNGVPEPKPVLEFLFKDAKDRQLTHIEFPIDDDDAKFDQKMEWLNQRLKHIWDEAIGAQSFPDEGLGSNANNFAEFYEDVALQFNKVKTSQEADAKTVYSQRPLYIKVVYNRNRLQFPLFPNFLQRAKNGDKLEPVITLTVDPTRDNIEPSKTVNAAAYTGGTDKDFGGGGISKDDFPDV